MASVTCRSCGRRYNYSQHDCCPECGAYNRPPRHEQVDADGTVRHLTDADYAKRKSAALDKVCFEEKECYEEKTCYEDEVRTSSSRQSIVEPEESKGDRRKNATIGIVMACIIILGTVIMAVRPGMTAEKKYREEHPAEEMTDEERLERWNDIMFGPRTLSQRSIGEEIVTGNGSVFEVMDWQRTDDAITIKIRAGFADPGDYFIAGLCKLKSFDEEGNTVWLYGSEIEEDGPYLLLRFPTENGGKLSPQTVSLHEHIQLEEYVYTMKTWSVSLKPLKSFTARGGAVFKLRGWWWENDVIVVKIDVEDSGSGHSVFFEMFCTDADGKTAKLTKYEYGYYNDALVLEFQTEEAGLTPRELIMTELDKRGTEILSTWKVDLEPDTGSARGLQTAAEAEGEQDVRLPQIYTAQEASELGLLEWQRTDQGIKLTLYADAGSLFPELECVDAAGNEVILEDCTRSPYYPVVFRFFTEDGNLTPRAFVLNGFDDETKETVTYYRFYLEPEQ